MVEGTIYHHKKGLGYFVAVDDKFDGLIPKKEAVGILEVLDRVEGRVIHVLPDGKITLSLKEKAKVRRENDSTHLEKILDKYHGTLPVGDKSSPEEIEKVTGLSKGAFKRAAGKLYKEKKAVPYPDRLEKVGKKYES